MTSGCSCDPVTIHVGVDFLDPGRVPKRYGVVVDAVVGVGVVTVFEKCLKLS